VLIAVAGGGRAALSPVTLRESFVGAAEENLKGRTQQKHDPV